MILRFMGDLPEPVPNQSPLSLRSPQLMQEIASILGAKPRRFVRQTVKRQPKPFGNANGQRGAEEFYQLWLNAGSSHLDKIHFIIGHGILKEELRLEFFYTNLL